jgi:hypothetical protein
VIKSYIFVLPLALFLFACEVKSSGNTPDDVSVTASSNVKPELNIENQAITFNKLPLKLGDSLKEWKKVLGGHPRCDEAPPGPVLCIWDELGISVGTVINRSTVKFINVYVRIEEKNEEIFQFPTNPDGSPSQELPSFEPKAAFPGYLRMDHMTIDAKTTFKEIRAKAERKRGLRCGLRDCSHPGGMFSASAAIYMRLTRPDENGTLYELSISGD